MAVTATITGKEMGAITVTAKVFSNFRSIKFTPNSQNVSIEQADGTVRDIDVSGATTLTGTIGATALTFVVS
jgi:hypothetical protein